MKKFKKSLVIYCASVVAVMAILILGVWLFADKLLKNDIEQSGVCIVQSPEDYANKDFSDKIVNGVLKLEDCGAAPDSNYDYGDLIRSAIKTCIQNDAILELEKDAVYYCSPTEDNPDFLFDLSGDVVSTFTMQGNGATIMNCDNFSGLFRFVDGAVVDISGLTYDYVVVPWVQGEIVAIDEESQTMTLLMDDDYTILDDERFADNKETEFGMFRNGENPKLIDDDSLHYFRFNNIRKIEDRGYEVTIWNHYRELGNTVDIGGKIVINNRRDSGYSVFDVRTCGDVKLTDITVYAANGCIVLGHHNVGDITLENVDVTYKPDSNRWITTNSDGIHIWGCTGKVSLNNCTFEGLSDDGMNLYQGGAVVTEQISETEFIVSGENANAFAPQQKGEEIIFFKADDGSTQGEATVVASEVVENKNYQLVRKITVDTPIKGVVTGTDRSMTTMVFRKNQMFEGTSITNCTFRNIRARAIVLRTLNTTIENNTIENTSNHGIYIGNWNYEGPYCDGVTIKNNKINNCGYLTGEANSYKAGAIGIYTETWDNGPQGLYPVHKNIVIEGNTITDYHGHAVRIGNTVSASVVNNIFKVDHDLTYEENSAVYVDTSQSVEITGNTFEDKRDGVQGDIIYDGTSTGNIKTDGNKYGLSTDKNVIKK